MRTVLWWCQYVLGFELTEADKRRIVRLNRHARLGTTMEGPCRPVVHLAGAAPSAAAHS